jgi:hypothetical protein
MFYFKREREREEIKEVADEDEKEEGHVVLCCVTQNSK